MLSSFFYFHKLVKYLILFIIMKNVSKNNAIKEINKFFDKKDINSKDVKKIKKIASSIRVRLKENRKKFCKKCHADLKLGIVRVSRGIKSSKCAKCGFVNRWKI